MKQYTEAERTALIEKCNAAIKSLTPTQGVAEQLGLACFEIALAALTAQPVKLPKGFSPAIGEIFDSTAPVMRRNSSDGKWLHKADVAKILNDLGYEVKE